MVHLTDEDHVRSIKRAGIKRRRFRFRDDGVDGAVFAMPILPSYWVSHQWLRELRRRGRRLIVGVDFRLPAREKVLVGHYGGDHRLLPVGEATKVLLAQPDPRGWEMLVPRDIKASEIVRVREISQLVGWRFSPKAKGTRPCGCAYCQAGEPRSRRLRERHGVPPPPPERRAEVLARVAAASSPKEAWDALMDVGYLRRGAADVAAFARFAAHEDWTVRKALARALEKVKGGAALDLLVRLTGDEHPDVQARAASAILEGWRWTGFGRLRDATAPRVRKVLDEWLEERQP